MRRRKRQRNLLNHFLFYNSTNSNMTFEDVIEKMKEFIQKEPSYLYEIRIGTDSQIRRTSLFVTGIVIRRIGPDGIGKGAWACLKDFELPRRIDSLREKISMETTLSEEVIFNLPENFHEEILDILLPHADKGAGYDLKIHIDVGTKGSTKELISEMVGRVKSMGLEAEIKPDSYVASGYANRYTK